MHQRVVGTRPLASARRRDSAVPQSAHLKQATRRDPDAPTVLTARSLEARSAITAKNVGRLVAIVLDGEILIAPKILEPIPGGFVVIHVDPTKPIAAGGGRPLALLRSGELRGTWKATSITPVPP